MEWYDKAKEILEFHESKVAEHGAAIRGKKNHGWGLRQTAAHFGIDHASIFNYIRIGKALREYPHLKEARSYSTALDMLEHLRPWRAPCVFKEKLAMVVSSTIIDKQIYLVLQLREPIQGIEYVVASENEVHKIQAEPRIK